MPELPKVHSQRTSAPTEAQRRVVRRAADPCRADPATYALVLRHADQLRQAGVEDVEALNTALLQWGR